MASDCSLVCQLAPFPRLICPLQTHVHQDQACFSLWMAQGHYRCHASWIFRAYLETARLKDADVNDVPDGFGSLYPVMFSRRCEAPLSYHPRTRGL